MAASAAPAETTAADPPEDPPGERFLLITLDAALIAKSTEIDFNKLKELIKKRDFEDSNREISPLRKANDAIEFITDGYSIEEVADKIIDFYNEKIPKELQIL